MFGTKQSQTTDGSAFDFTDPFCFGDGIFTNQLHIHIHDDVSSIKSFSLPYAIHFDGNSILRLRFSYKIPVMNESIIIRGNDQLSTVSIENKNISCLDMSRRVSQTDNSRQTH